MGYSDPALEGQSITFACPPHQTLNGSNSSMCMGNGEWEPDPREVECTGGIRTTGATISGTLALDVTIICSSFFINIILFVFSSSKYN